MKLAERDLILIHSVRDYAKTRPLTFHDLRTQRPVGQDQSYVCDISDYRVVFTVEQQIVGLYRHFSVTHNFLRPKLEDVNVLLNAFGFTRTVTSWKVGDVRLTPEFCAWIEPRRAAYGFLAPHSAFNVLQPVGAL